MAPQLLQHDDYTVGWICALWQEQTAAKAMLDCIHEDLPQPQSDKNTYTLGTIAKYNVVIACLPCGEATHAAAAASSAWMVTTFPSIRFGLMVGIGGGIPPKVRLGDVVVSLPIDQFPGVVQWDVGTTQQDGFERTGSLNNPPTLLLRAVSKLRTDHDLRGSRMYNPPTLLLRAVSKLRTGHDLKGSRIPAFLEELKTKWPDMTKEYLKRCYNDVLFRADYNHVRYHDQNMEEEKFCQFCDVDESLSRGHRDMRIHYGLIASGNEVIEDALSRDKLNRNLGGDLLCVETEAAGLMNNFPCVVIRGICDYADSHRNKVWQKHAAAVAAAFAKELLGYVQPYEVDRERPVWEIVGQALETSRTTEDEVTNLDRQEHFQVLEWITPLSFGPQQSDNLQKRQKGTGQWLLDSDKFQQWINGSKQTLFCPGIPGAGKTTLSAMVIDHLEKYIQGDTTIGLAYIYFNFRSDHKAEDLVKSLLKQLSQPFSTLPDAVKGLYKEFRNKVRGPSYPEILKTLQSVAAMYSKLFLVVDALDECPTSDCCRDTFISETLALQAATGANIFATSRHVPEIAEKFMGALSLEIRANDEDVRKYVEDHISDMQFPVNTGLREIIKTVIVEAVDGRFLLAQLYLRSLADTISPTQMQRTLNEFRNRHKRSGEGEKYNILYEAYNDAMIRINRQEPDCEKLAKRTISWISCAKRPLKTKELQVALAVKADDTEINLENYTPIESMINVCGGLVAVDEKSNIIRLVHHTTQEYLEQYLGDWVPDAQEDIAKTCLRYLSFHVFDEGFCPSERSFKSKLDLNPFYDYAARNWGHHVRVAPKVDNTQVLKFLRNEAKVRGAHQAMYPSDYWIYDAYSAENQDDSIKVTGLHLAADFGLEKMTRVLLEEKQNPHLWDIFDMSPLCYAVRSGHEAVVSLLLDTKGSCPNLRITDQRMVLSRAIESEEKASAGMPFVMSARYPEVRNSSLQQSILSLAAEYGHEEVVDVLIKAKNIDLNPEYSPNPLLCAAGKGHVGVVELLLDAEGIEPDEADFVSERRPLSCAAERGHTKVVELLLATGQVDINSGDGYPERPPLSWAAADSSAKDAIELLLTQDGIEPHATDSQGRTPLSHAAERGNVSAVRALLSEGYFDRKDDNGRTPLTHAVINGQYTTAKLLLAEPGIDPDSSDDYGRTPLSYAAQGGQEQIVNILLAKAKVDPESRDKHGRTPLSHAAKWGHKKIINILLAKDGVDADSSDNYGQTPLSHAVKAGQNKVVTMLLARNDVRPNSKYYARG
ncbi:ankyrin repeat protein, partial [Metarhizium majus ARSEF 297]